MNRSELYRYRANGQWRVDVIDSSSHWASGGLRFDTKDDGERYALDLSLRWTALRDYRVVVDTTPEGEAYDG
jgi:hypothetical protein